MFIADYAIFFGREEAGFQTKFILEKNFYLVFEIKDSLSQEEIEPIILTTKEEVRIKEPKTLAGFKAVIDSQIKRLVKEESFSLAAGLLVDDILYLLTVGGGEVYLKRGNKTELIIKGNNTASGYLKNNDFFIFASKNFSLLIDKQELNNQLNDFSPKEAVENLTPKLKEKEDVGVIAVFLKFYQQKEDVKKETDFEPVVKPPTRGAFLLGQWEKLKGKFARYQQQTPRGKKITFLIVLFLFFVLLWSVVFGYQRRARQRLINQVKSHREKITTRLSEAVDLSTINLNRSLVLLSQAKKDFNDLEKIVGKKKIKEVEGLKKLIASKEKEILKKQEKKSEEFYDLALINKGVQGEKFYLDRETVAILNAKAGEIYTLSLTKKSNRTIKNEAIKNARLVSFYNDKVFFLNTEKGVYQIDQNDKLRLVVKKDDDWGKIVDFWVYNGNLYLLDKDKDEIYKYLVAEGGYSGKTSYFKKGQSIDLGRATSMAIDSSIYIATDSEVYKFTAGVRDEFSLTLPRKEEVNISKIFTNKEANKIYLWDRSKGRVYLVSKNGQYERQINSTILSKALDLVVLEDKDIFVLVKDKIDKIALD